MGQVRSARLQVTSRYQLRWYRLGLETLEARSLPGETVPSLLAASALLAPVFPDLKTILLGGSVLWQCTL
jgi:hypothetical protein